MPKRNSATPASAAEGFVPVQRTARDRILDAAAEVMRDKGLAAATTKEIARAAGYSEAMLYKYFDDKQEIFLRVMGERMPSFHDPDVLIGIGTVRGNLEDIVGQLLRFYVRTFPIAASIFSTPQLLAVQREGVRSRGGGPERPVEALEAYLRGEIEEGRLPKEMDAKAVSRLLAGAALQQAFLACFDALDEVPDINALARSLVAPILPAHQ